MNSGIICDTMRWGTYRVGQQHKPFWLEWDCVMMNVRDLAVKFDSYAHNVLFQQGVCLFQKSSKSPLPVQRQSFLSQSRSAKLLLPETLMWKGIYQAGAQMPNSLPSGSVNCAHLPQGSTLNSRVRFTPRALSVSQVASIPSVCKT